jgi:muconolactone delta-isomerase
VLFLVRVEVREALPTERGDLLERVVLEWETVSKLVADGRIKAGGKLAGRRGAVAVFEIEDSAALKRIVEDLPLWRYFSKVEILPLIPPDEALATARRWKALYSGGGASRSRTSRSTS